jgi:hypothetical protein
LKAVDTAVHIKGKGFGIVEKKFANSEIRE